MKTKLHRLKEHNAQRFIEDVSEQKSYTQRIALKRVKKVRDPNMYLKKS